jgi:ABC-2 type transport system ATP-binding protein
MKTSVSKTGTIDEGYSSHLSLREHSYFSFFAMTAVEAKDVMKRYGSRVAVHDLSFSADAGEILGVLGPNGAGKTTAFRILTTILEPTRGTFAVAGVPQTKPEEIRRRIGVLPESAGYPERQTGHEFLRYHARLFGHSRASARALADQLLADVRLAERGNSLISGYSRGMRQRLGIARALVNEPQVLFLDEPTLGLDPAGQRQILSTIRRVAEGRGATVLLSTHLLAEVEEICSRVIILNRGRIVADGTVADVSRQAGAPRSARLRVAADDVERTLTALANAPVVEQAEVASRQLGWLTMTLARSDGRPPDEVVRDALRVLIDAGIPLLSFELEGSRLSDAFLAMTESA